MQVHVYTHTSGEGDGCIAFLRVTPKVGDLAKLGEVFPQSGRVIDLLGERLQVQCVVARGGRGWGVGGA